VISIPWFRPVLFAVLTIGLFEACADHGARAGETISNASAGAAPVGAAAGSTGDEAGASGTAGESASGAGNELAGAAGEPSAAGAAGTVDERPASSALASPMRP